VVYALFGKNVLGNLKYITEETCNKIMLLQSPQCEYENLSDPDLRLREGEMWHILSAFAIAGGSRGNEADNYHKLKEDLKKRGYLLVEPGEDFLKKIGDRKSKEKMQKFLDKINISDALKFKNGIIQTDSGMQATVVFDPDKKIRVFFVMEQILPSPEEGCKHLWQTLALLLIRVE
jgi:hypothetical protein